MSVLSFVLFLLAALYIFGALFEFPIMFEGNPKTKFLISKMGKRNYKILLFALATVFVGLALLLK
jgi:Sec-independent protein secretion pathway component TatC